MSLKMFRIETINVGQMLQIVFDKNIQLWLKHYNNRPTTQALIITSKPRVG
jgi:hypothetical protein